MFADGKAGYQVVGDGAPSTLRVDRTGALVVGQCHGDFTEASIRGKLMIAANPVAGVAHGTAFAATSGPLCLWNPPNSGFVANLVRVSMAYVSGTLGAGNVALGFVSGQVAAPTATAITVQNCLLGGPKGVVQAYSAVTAALAAAPTLIRGIFSFGPMLATSVFQPTPCETSFDGTISVPPGTALVIQGIATAGTSPLVIFSATWEEVPL